MSAQLEPAPTTRTRVYPWAKHARYLRDHPDQWVLLESAVPSGPVRHVRTGRQADMAKLMPHLELRTRNTRLLPEGRSVRSELWARYTPDRQARNGDDLSDDKLVREVRELFASGDRTVYRLAEDMHLNPATVHSWVTGRTRKSAGGPTVKKTRKPGRPRKN